MEKVKYREKCKERWHGDALIDAFCNFEDWVENHEYLVEAMKKYIENPEQVDLAGKYHNPSGSLHNYMLNCQEAIQPNKRRLDPFLDFEERYQKIFLKRGLLIYCEMILDELQTECATPQNQITIFA